MDQLSLLLLVLSTKVFLWTLCRSTLSCLQMQLIVHKFVCPMFMCVRRPFAENHYCLHGTAFSTSVSARIAAASLGQMERTEKCLTRLQTLNRQYGQNSEDGERSISGTSASLRPALTCLLAVVPLHIPSVCHPSLPTALTTLAELCIASMVKRTDVLTSCTHFHSDIQTGLPQCSNQLLQPLQAILICWQVSRTIQQQSTIVLCVSPYHCVAYQSSLPTAK